MEKVKPPIQEDLNRGWMVQLNKEKVLVEFRDDLHIYIYIFVGSGAKEQGLVGRQSCL